MTDHNSDRRTYLKLASTGAIASIAGCGGGGTEGEETDEGGGGGVTDDDSGGTSPTDAEETEVAETQGDDLVIPTYLNPEEVSYLIAFDGDRWYEWGTDYDWSDTVIGVMHESAWWANWASGARQGYLAPNPHPPEWRMAEGRAWGDEWEDRSWGRPASEIETRAPGGEQADAAWGWEIAEDAVWEDGEPVTAEDSVMQTLYSRNEGDPPWNRLEQDMEVKPVEAWEDVVFPDGLDGKIVQFTDPWGAMQQFSTPWEQWGEGLLTGGGRIGNRGFWPTHKEPYKGIVPDALDYIDRVIENPTDEFMNRGEWARNVAQIEKDDFETWRDPDHVVGNGAWKLSDIRGTEEIVYEPNENFRHGTPEFDRLRLTYQEAPERRIAEFQAGRLDILEEALPAELWSEVPNSYDWKEGGGVDAAGIALDFSDPHLGKRNVRAAINHAINKQEVANSFHPELARGVTNPPGQAWGVDTIEAFEGGWIEENLVDYSHDTDRADELMRMEGYERNGNGQWVGPDGEALEYTFNTDFSDPKLGLGIAEHLSRWGIPIDVETIDSATFTEQMEDGQFTMWRSGSGQGGFFNYMHDRWPHSHNTPSDLLMYGMYPEEDIQWVIDQIGGENAAVQYSLFADADLTWDIPPIGEPQSDELMDGEPFNVVWHVYQWRLTRADQLGGKHDWWKKTWWANNWTLAPNIPIYDQFGQVWRNTQKLDWSPAEDSVVWPFYGDTWWTWGLLGDNLIHLA